MVGGYWLLVILKCLSLIDEGEKTINLEQVLGPVLITPPHISKEGNRLVRYRRILGRESHTSTTYIIIVCPASRAK